MTAHMPRIICLPLLPGCHCCQAATVLERYPQGGGFKAAPTRCRAPSREDQVYKTLTKQPPTDCMRDGPVQNHSPFGTTSTDFAQIVS